MPSWADGEDKYMAAYRGESVDDAPAPCRDCRDGVNWHCGDCGCCREEAPRAEPEDESAPAPRASALAVELSRRVFVDSDGFTLGAFLDQLMAYGDARVAEAEAERR